MIAKLGKQQNYAVMQRIGALDQLGVWTECMHTDEPHMHPIGDVLSKTYLHA